MTTTLRLFHKRDPFRQIETRDLDSGELIIGRDPAVGWCIADPALTLSRRHCVIGSDEGALTLCDTSTNGVLVGQERKRAPRGSPLPIAVGDTLHLGEFLIVIEAGAEGARQPLTTAPIHPQPDAAPPREGGDPVAVDHAAPGAGNGTLASAGEAGLNSLPTPSPTAEGASLEAFCAGAHMDASAFSGEDPAEVMGRLGAVYRQMVLGLVELMGERTLVRGQFAMDQTTVGAEGNNPFRWASAERVGVDLLRASEAGFLIGPSAVRGAFTDVRGHLAGILAGMRGAIASVIESLGPQAVENEVRAQPFSVGGRTAKLWSAYVRRHAQFREAAKAHPQSPAEGPFRAAYERHDGDLERAGTTQ